MLALLLPYTGQVAAFEAGYFRWERNNHVPVPVHVTYGPPVDPVTGQRLDRSWRWQFDFGGYTLDAFAKVMGNSAENILESFWPRCSAYRIDHAEYQYLIDLADYAREHEPDSPFASSRGRIDLLSASVPTPGE